MVAIDAFLKALPFKVVVGSRDWGPDPKDVINIASVEGELWELIVEDGLMDGKIEGPVCRGRRCAHGGPLKLKKAGVTKCKDVVLHNEGKGFKQWFDGDGGEVVFVCLDVGTDSVQG